MPFRQRMARHFGDSVRERAMLFCTLFPGVSGTAHEPLTVSFMPAPDCACCMQIPVAHIHSCDASIPHVDEYSYMLHLTLLSFPPLALSFRPPHSCTTAISCLVQQQSSCRTTFANLHHDTAFSREVLLELLRRIINR
jgi:hypothetical protein